MLVVLLTRTEIALLILVPMEATWMMVLNTSIVELVISASLIFKKMYSYSIYVNKLPVQ
jgi:hypothetical protein